MAAPAAAPAAPPPVLAPPKSSIAASGYAPAESRFMWTLEGLTPQSFSGADLEARWESPEFCALGTRWKVVLRPHRLGEGVPGARTALHVQLTEPHTKVTPGAVIIEVTGKSNCCTLSRRIFSTKEPPPPNASRSLGWSTMLMHDKLAATPHRYLPDGKLTVRVRIRARTLAEAQAADVPPPSLASELACSLDSGEGADVTITAGGRQFRAHSYVLALRSPTLKAQLWGPMASKPPFKLTVPPEIQPSIFERVLRFIYTDDLAMSDSDPDSDSEESDSESESESVSVSHEEAQHLLHAAGFYGLPRLHALCVKQLCAGLTVDNALSTLELAHVNSAAELLDCVLRFAAAHASVVMASASWAALQAAHPELVSAVVHTLAHGEPPGVIASIRAAAQENAAEEAAAPAARRGTKRGAPE